MQFFQLLFYSPTQLFDVPLDPLLITVSLLKNRTVSTVFSFHIAKSILL